MRATALMPPPPHGEGLAPERSLAAPRSTSTRQLVRKGTAAPGVQRRYTGTAGRIELPDGKVLVLGGNKAYPTVANGDQPEGLHRPDGHRPGAGR
jgi:hypothetical protein